MGLTEKDIRAIQWCLTLPEDMVEATDFEAEEAIKVNYSVKLPSSYSLGKWIYKTSNQWNLWACTALWTTHWVQILNVKKNWVVPTDRNIITPEWKDLWGKMWHSTTEYDWGDYIEKAVSTALKLWILIEENWELAKFDAYATQDWDRTDKGIDLMKRYLYQGCPIIWNVRWDKTTWNEMTKWEIKTVPTNPTGWHCIALVGWDERGFWFVNSWKPNDDRKLKSRFYISYNTLKAFWSKFNYRYWVLYMESNAEKDPEYLKRKNNNKLILEVLKKQYSQEPAEVQNAIVILSQAIRKNYPEINSELPL